MLNEMQTCNKNESEIEEAGVKERVNACKKRAEKSVLGLTDLSLEQKLSAP